MRDINLLPEKYLNAKKANINKYLYFLIVIVTLALGGYTAALYQNLQSVNEDITNLQNKIAQLENPAPQSQNEKTEYLVYKIKNEAPEITTMYDYATSKTPSGMVISRIWWQNNQFTISGTAKSNEQVTQYLEELQKKKEFKKVNIKKVQENSPGNFSFELMGSS